MTQKAKLNRYESNVLALPPLRMVLGDVPSPDPERRRSPRDAHKSQRDMERTVRRIIAHLEEDEK